MRIEVNVPGDEMPSLLALVSKASGIPIARGLLDDYARDIRRTRGRFIATYDEAKMTPGSLEEADERIGRFIRGDESGMGSHPLSRAVWDLYAGVNTITRNYVLFSIMMFWPLGTSVYLSFALDGTKQVGLIATNEPHEAQRGWKKLI